MEINFRNMYKNVRSAAQTIHENKIFQAEVRKSKKTLQKKSSQDLEII